MAARLTRKVINKIIVAQAKGLSTRKTAEIAGVTQKTVMKYRHDKNVRKEIEALQQRYLDEVAKDLVDSHVKIVKQTKQALGETKTVNIGTKEIPIWQDITAIETQPTLAKLYAGVSKGVAQAIGIHPSPTPSILIQQNILQGPGSTILGASANDLIAKMVESGQGYGGMLLDDDDDAIDVEAIDVGLEDD
jgi:predicted transcriptional regulator